MAFKFKEEKAEKLEKSRRYDDFRPKSRLRKAGFSEGQRVLDIGSGTGFYTRAASQLVKSDGFVVGIDILKGMIEKATTLGVPENVEYRLSKESEFPVDDGEFDWAIMTNLYHELHEPDDFIGEIRRALKPDGHLYLTDWIPQEEEDGPPTEHRVAKFTVVAAFEEHGFRVESEAELNNSHYELVLISEE
ncbi:MAG: Ubiquinone/menaquinone biosynthesis C-methyltransferase UbiE [Candidatus Marinimicrobia bacterium]|nr:Ubiquinone/menaquinone biosynthesis C-methyltransferase UbiE [Candidatus Neomarinimicrobiota bacterium]